MESFAVPLWNATPPALFLTTGDGDGHLRVAVRMKDKVRECQALGALSLT